MQNQTTSSAMNAKRDITSKGSGFYLSIYFDVFDLWLFFVIADAGGSHQKVETPAKFYRRVIVILFT